MSIIGRQSEQITMCQIVVRTQLDLGTDEQQFFANMGQKIFGEIFSYLLTDDRGIGINMAFNALTGKTKFLDGVSLAKLRGPELPEQVAHAIEVGKTDRENEVRELADEINELKRRISELDNAIQQAYNSGINPRQLIDQADRNEIARNELIVKLNNLFF